jgi:hypothetical protein
MAYLPQRLNNTEDINTVISDLKGTRVHIGALAAEFENAAAADAAKAQAEADKAAQALAEAKAEYAQAEA